MRPVRFDNIVAFSLPAQSATPAAVDPRRQASGARAAVAFHVENLQVASLDADAWAALTEPENASAEAKGEILAWNRERDPDVRDAAAAEGVRYLSINVSQICNLRCSYCAAGGDGSFGDPRKHIDLEKAYAQLERFLAPLPQGSRFVLNFLGGEPLAAPNAIEALIARARLLTAGRKIDLVYKITTNATLINSEIAEMLAERRFHVQISLDGPPEINDRSRPTAGGKGSSTMAMRGARQLFERKDRLGSIAVNAVHGAHHADALASHRWLRNFPWDRISLSFDAACRDPESSARFAESFCEAAEEAWALGGEAELRRLHDINVCFETIDSRARNRNFCGAGKSQLLLDASAKLYACYWWANDAREELSGPDGGLDGELSRERLQAYASDLVDKHGCGSCWARNICGGGCMHVNKVASGDKSRKDALFCERTRRMIAKGVELYERARRDVVEHGF